MAVLTRQVRVWGRRSGSVTFWAWTVSLAVHLIVLTAFGLVKFSQAQADTKQRPSPTAKVNQIKRLIEAAPVIPKPKVKKPAKDRLTKKTNRLLPVNRIFSTAKPGSQDWAYPAKSSAPQGAFSLSSSANLSHRIEFFGSFTATPNAKICYLVDCSGSMRGSSAGFKKSSRILSQAYSRTSIFTLSFSAVTDCSNSAMAALSGQQSRPNPPHTTLSIRSNLPAKLMHWRR